jgi:hypothetical protein
MLKAKKIKAKAQLPPACSRQKTSKKVAKNGKQRKITDRKPCLHPFHKLTLKLKTPSGVSFDKDSRKASKHSYEVYLKKKPRN